MKHDPTGQEERARRVAVAVVIAILTAIGASCSMFHDLDRGNNEPTWQDRELIERNSTP